jgi:hypothetical protein
MWYPKHVQSDGPSVQYLGCFLLYWLTLALLCRGEIIDIMQEAGLGEALASYPCGYAVSTHGPTPCDSQGVPKT